MAALIPLLRGSLREHPLAIRFAEEVLRIHRRYATEIVAQNRLCPHLKDVETGFGRFIVVLDPLPDVNVAVEAVLAAESTVVHVVYPCARPSASDFEKFAGKLREGLKKAIPSPPVMATFHPELAGDPGGAYRAIGLLRRAPDPFVQLIPEGLHQGGTVLATGGLNHNFNEPHVSAVDNALSIFSRIKGAPLELLVAGMAEIHRDRAASYAPFLKELGLPPMGLPAHLQ
ncbi:MAG: hypothetical protein ABI193_15630 [Minicystis sp.]